MSLGEHFARPEAAPLFLVVPIVFAALLLLGRARTRRLERALGPRTEALTRELGPGRRRLRIGLFSGALLLAVIAVLQPRWGRGTEGLLPRGANLVVCLDVSRSMLAEDVEPGGLERESRLERARIEIRDLARRAVGDRLGLVVFAGEARLAIPLTRDRESFATLASRAGPLAVPSGGTDLGAALLTALDALSARTEGHEAVLLITDGEDLTGREREAAATCRARGIPVHCLGLGSELGAKIPVDSGGGFVRDRSGRDVVTRLNSASLREIAEITGGDFAGPESGPGAVVEIYEDGILPVARRSFRAEERRERENRYQWPLMAALLLWIAELGFSERRR